LEEFIKQNISGQHLKLDRPPSLKSASVIQKLIDKIRTEFRTNKKYHGHQVSHFNLIPKLLERLMLYFSCFKTQLPLYELSEELLDNIEKNAVTTISTSTGSGKSTLLPALLVAEGYDKVIVTQPRRLPCQLICNRVNETMMIDVGSSSKKLAGWAVSGADRNPEAKVLYLTDGLLKERLLYDENFITTHTKLNKSVVFFIDEVHERSVNIDLCLALLARLLTTKPELKSKMKVIISSATLDSSVPNLFRKIPQAGLAEFKMPKMGTLHPVTKIPRPNENILDIVQELCKTRRRHDQILCFVNSVSDVNQCCRLIAEISRGTIVAYPLVQSQHPDVQQSNIEHGTLFFSTTVAETSLTFPCLKYVIDTGMINTPVYDVQSKRTVLKEVRAAESTIKQRLGRLGRTQPGEYYSLYSFKADDVPYPIPQICQSDLMNIEFSLRKSPLKKGLQYMKDFLPDKPSQQYINSTIHQLKQLSKC
jgi:HrpA-like RNA helicase